MARRCDHVELPDWYLGPTRKPSTRCTGYESGPEMLWDMMDHWPTTAEWLAWVRRRDGRKKYYGRHGWQYPVRPIIAAHRLPWTTMKVRRLPKDKPGLYS
jgi:hypothetical protein